MIRKDKLHIVLLVCALLLCLAANGSVATDGGSPRAPVTGTAALADGPEETGSVVDILSYELETEDGLPDGHVPLYINGVLSSDCLVIDGVARMSVGRFASLTGLDYDGVSVAGLTPAVSESGEYAEANGRYFYFADGLCERGGELLWPLRELARMFSCEVRWDEASGSIDLDVTGFAPIESGGEFYDEDELYWLSRIIYSESGNQPLSGQIGVGCVVLNRVESPIFPDSVYEVIFERTLGTAQFSPVASGTIYAEPDEEAVIAAKLCLEGYNTVGDSLYFVNPAIGASGWFAANLTFVTRIADHDFYA